MSNPKHDSRYYEFVAMIGFKPEWVASLNKVQDNVIFEDKDKTYYFLVNQAMYARGLKFSRYIIGPSTNLVDDYRLTLELVRLNTPSLLGTEESHIELANFKRELVDRKDSYNNPYVSKVMNMIAAGFNKDKIINNLLNELGKMFKLFNTIITVSSLNVTQHPLVLKAIEENKTYGE